MSLTVKIANQSLHMTLWPMLTRHSTKFGYNRFSSSEDIIPTNSETLNLCCDLYPEHSNPIFSQDTHAHDDVPPY